MSNELLTQLSMPFRSHEIAFRVSREVGSNATVLAYITARGIMNRLDQVFGLDGWKDEYQIVEKGVVCSLSCQIDGQWITKVDAAPFTSIEPLKGGFSDALKRAGVKFGIGRYLYDLPEQWVDLLAEKPKKSKNYVHSHKTKANTYKYWVDPVLPAWALPDSSDMSEDEVDSDDALLMANKDELRRAERHLYDNHQLVMDDIRKLNLYVLGVEDAKESFDSAKIIHAINFICDVQNPLPPSKLSVDSIDAYIEIYMQLEYPHDNARSAAFKKYQDRADLLEHLRDKRDKRMTKLYGAKPENGVVDSRDEKLPEQQTELEVTA